MDRYFIEFEFQSTLGGVYWFPLIILALDQTIAGEVAQAFRTGIEARYRLRHAGSPAKLDGVPQSDLLAAYIEQRSRGTAVALNVAEYTIRGIKPDLELNVDRNLELAAAAVDESFDGTIASLRQRQFRIRMMRGDDLEHDGPFLAISIVNPQSYPHRQQPNRTDAARPSRGA